MRRARFEVSHEQAQRELLEEMGRLGAITTPAWLIISTNIPIRRDGLPYSRYSPPADPGVAVYFRLGGQPHVMACDAWDMVGDNIRAIGLTVAAQRAISRYKVGTLEQAFSGYLRLPPPSSPSDWRQILGLGPGCSLEQANAAYRLRAKLAHPDHGGDQQRIIQLNQAIESARKELGAYA